MADGNVIHFPESVRAFFVCNHCGCRSWFVLDDGGIMCASCGVETLDHGRLQVPDVEARERAEGEPEEFTSRHLETDAYDLQVRRIADRIANGEFSNIVAIKPDGGLYALAAPEHPIDTSERRRWLLRKLRGAYELIVKGS